jgi:hypothetical protein
MQSRDFFKPEFLDPYRNDPRIIKALNGSVLLNYAEFMNWYKQPDPRMSMRNLGKRDRTSDVEEIHTLMKNDLKQIANRVCENKIDLHYGISAILNLNFERFDILVALAPGYDKVKRDEFKSRPSVSLKHKTRHILGFLIVEKGECKMRPTEYTVNLICSRSMVEYRRYGKRRGLERERLRGALLLGAYIYSCKRMDQEIGLLELADGYKNISGFFSYSKMGFVKDESLFGRQCFKDHANLPMSVRVGKYSYDKIIDYACGEDRIRHFEDDTGILNLSPITPRQKEIQRKFASLCNLEYQIPYILKHEHQLDPNLDKNEIDFLDVFYAEFYNRFSDEYPELDDHIDYIKIKKNEFINDFDASSPSKPHGGTKKREYSIKSKTMKHHR